MTPIRFRAWHKENKVMCTVDSIDLFNDGYDVHVYNTVSGNEELWNGNGEAVDNANEFILMQSTALTDKNGVEIFEGDVLDTGTRKLEVRWSKETCRYWLYDKPRTKLEKMAANQGGEKHDEVGLEISKWGYCKQTEIIGNIYANPELL